MKRIGVDIQELSPFIERNIETDKDFLKKIYSEEELDYCFSKAHPEFHLAGKFAAKEAVIKILPEKYTKIINLSNILVLNYTSGKPYIVITENRKSDDRQRNHQQDNTLYQQTAYKDIDRIVGQGYDLLKDQITQPLGLSNRFRQCFIDRGFG